MRELAAVTRVDYVPISLADVSRLVENGRLAFDTALLQVSPPDRAGMCSLGVSVDIGRVAALSARRVIAEINPHMPRTGRQSEVPFDRFDRIVHVDEPIIEYVHEPLGPAAERIARYAARLINDGATLQIGLGRVPNEMLRFLAGRRDLGIHSDVITEPLVDLVEQGVVTGANKSLHRGQVVAGMAMGTRRLYDLIDDDARFAFHPIEYVCAPEVIAANRELVSVTQAFAIDLTGQVCADARDGVTYGGVATQPDFHRGAIRSAGGKAIICLTSTTPDGQSAIRPRLLPGEAVAIPRADVHHVITEYGSAYLFGRSLAERALALIEIAHPDHREHLVAAAAQQGLLSQGQVPRSRAAYPVEDVLDAKLRDGRRVTVRPTRATNVPALHALFFRLRPKTCARAFSATSAPSPTRWRITCAASATCRRWRSPPSSAARRKNASSGPAATTSTRRPDWLTWRTWWTRHGRAWDSASSFRRASPSTRRRTACAASRPTSSRTMPGCWACFAAPGARSRAASWTGHSR
jgi:acyl-CoA hydrolase